MDRINKIILCSFLFTCYFQQCLTTNLTFQNATLFCKTFHNATDSILGKSPKEINCTSSGYKVVTVKGTVTTIFENVVTDFSNVNTLNFLNVGLKEIQPGAFRNFPKLEILILNDNNINDINSGVFQDLPLAYLFMHNSSITTLHKGAFQNLQNLKILSLDNNHLKKIQKGIFDNISLWILNLTNNQVEEIEPGAFDNIYADSYKWNILMYLSNNKLKVVSPEVFNVEYLVTLNLDNNHISDLRPGDLANLPNLRDLILSRNQLKFIQNGVFSGSNIEKLDLSHNEISAVETEAFDDMEHLLELKISHNRLKTWNGGWFSGSWSSGFVRNRNLDASYNSIEEIPDHAFTNFGNNNNIIRLQWNKIKKISDAAFEGLRHVRLLDLSHNKLKEWKTTLMQSVRVIETVDLSDNEFKCSDLDSKTVIVPRARRVILYNCLQFDRR